MCIRDSLLIILFVVPLIAQETIYFKRGSYGNTLKGKLISIKLNQQLNPDNGFTSEVVFQPNNRKGVPLLLSGGALDNGRSFIFDVKEIDKIISRGVYTKTVLFSKKIQKEYSNREEIELIISEADERKSQRIQRGEIFFNVTYYCIIPLGLFFVIIFGDYP